jgi:chromosome segregation ATPase
MRVVRRAGQEDDRSGIPTSNQRSTKGEEMTKPTDGMKRAAEAIANHCWPLESVTSVIDDFIGPEIAERDKRIAELERELAEQIERAESAEQEATAFVGAIDEAKAELKRAQADAAAMREALSRCFEQLMGQQAMPDDSQNHIYEAALSKNAGQLLLDELKRLRTDNQAMRDEFNSIPCQCIEAYKSRRKVDPQCHRCQYDESAFNHKASEVQP